MAARLVVCPKNCDDLFGCYLRRKARVRLDILYLTSVSSVSVKYLLVISVAINAALLIVVGYLNLQPTEGTSVLSGNRSAIESIGTYPKPNFASGATGGIPKQGRSEVDFLRALRKLGYPERTLVAVAKALVAGRFEASKQALLRPPGSPTWNQRYRSLTTAERTQLDRLEKQQRDELKVLLDAADVGTTSEAGSEALPSEKRQRIDQINADFLAARRAANVAIGSRTDFAVDQKWRAELAAVLSRDEFDRYIAYHSPGALRLQQRLADVALSDSEYESLFRKLDDHRRQASDELGTESFVNREVRIIEQQASAEAAAVFARRDNQTFSQVAAVLGPEATARTILDKYYIWSQLHIDLADQSKLKNGAPPPDLIASYYRRLTEGLSDSQRLAFDRSETGAALLRWAGKR